jgi:RNA polymerase sigma factor (TIGR02999 family)
MSMPPRDVTRLLIEWSEGDVSALETLMPLVFDDLRSIARRQFQRERSDHTLQPTALISEVYLRLYGQQKVHWDNRAQFFAFAGVLMRRVLVDHAKGRLAAKRGKGLANLPLDEAIGVPDGRGVDVIELDEALSRLAQIDERLSRLVELRFFVGLSNEETAEVLGISVSSVKREWQMAKLWLYKELKRE